MNDAYGADVSDVEDELELYEEFDPGYDDLDNDDIEDEVEEMSYD